MKERQQNERILELLIAQEFDKLSDAESDELLELLEHDKVRGGVFKKLMNDRDKLIDHIIEFTKQDKNEEDLKRVKEEFFEKIKGKQS